MSEQQKNTLITRNQIDQFTPTLIYCLLSLFIILVLWIQIDNTLALFSNTVIYVMIFIEFLSIGIGVSILFSYLYREKKGNNDYIENMFNLRTFELRGVNTNLFYAQFQNYILKEDKDYFSLEKSIQKKKILYMLLGSCLIGIIIVSLNSVLLNSFKIFEFVKFIGFLFLSGALISRMIQELRSLEKRKMVHLKIDAITFNSLPTTKKRKLYANPKNKEQKQIYEFLELANLLQKYHQNYGSKFKKSTIYCILTFILGTFLTFYSKSDPILKNLGLGILLFDVIIFGIKIAQYNTSKNLVELTKLVLNSTVFVF
ncbi:hypothetical protein NEF87_000010 [Candidatus Lokiarchaeum ossiferum]|uniref:Uncharacterized protein n=1 Tax=Candidatus Lokiarchaeum ossiferum TaxID=2951803 RepID=A0ABY6HJM3_9ARCH|nr:hypothetical protein NEF87_000010 [Candidatus Lokiarchaeum sp. B-35]